jgi:hypothetical protein
MIEPWLNISTLNFTLLIFRTWDPQIEISVAVKMNSVDKTPQQAMEKVLCRKLSCAEGPLGGRVYVSQKPTKSLQCP